MGDISEISVVICAYTEARWRELLAALDSLRSQTVPPLEVILVIDHNPELLARVMNEVSGVIVTENLEERGLSGGRNTGIVLSRGDVIAFMDEDAVAAPDWIERMQADYQASDVIGVGGSIRPLWEDQRPAWFPEEFDWVVGCTYRGMPQQPSAVRNLIGCNMSFHREIFQIAGGFRTGMGRIGTLPVGCEETELCIRANTRFRNGKLLYDPAVVVSHRVPAWRAAWKYFFSRCYSEGISKSQVARWVGADQGLSNERTYTLHTLPQGVLRGLKDTFFKGQLGGLGRAFAILSGLLVTTVGYLAGSITRHLLIPVTIPGEPEAIPTQAVPPLRQPAVMGAGNKAHLDGVVVPVEEPQNPGRLED